MVGKMKVRFEILSKLHPFGGTCQFSWFGTAFLLSQSLNAQKLRSGLQSDLPGGGNSCYIDFFSCWSSLFLTMGLMSFCEPEVRWWFQWFHDFWCWMVLMIIHLAHWFMRRIFSKRLGMPNAAIHGWIISSMSFWTWTFNMEVAFVSADE